MKRALPILAIAVGCGAVAVFLWVLITAVFYSPQAEIALVNPTPISVNPPARLIIPVIDLDVHVQQAGLLAGNRMASPTNFTDVAWYKYGPSPGELGSAVIAGHLDNRLGLSGVFKNLSKLQVGDEVDIVTTDGTVLTFTVEKLVIYPYDQVPPTIFTETDGARLNLITCAGEWIKTPALGWTVDHRLIVYTTFTSEGTS